MFQWADLGCDVMRAGGCAEVVLYCSLLAGKAIGWQNANNHKPDPRTTVSGPYILQGSVPYLL